MIPLGRHFNKFSMNVSKVSKYYRTAKSMDFGLISKLALLCGAMYLAWKIHKDMGAPVVTGGPLPTDTKGTPKVVSTPTKVNVINNAQAISIANELYEAMASVGTDEDTIELKRRQLMNSPGSLLKVYNAFGKKPYSQFGAPVWPLSGDDKDLKGWLMCELSEGGYNLWAKLFTAAGL